MASFVKGCDLAWRDNEVVEFYVLCQYSRLLCFYHKQEREIEGEREKW